MRYQTAPRPVVAEFRAGSVRSLREHVFVMRDGAPVQKCCRCGELKPAEDFAWRRKDKDQRDSHCRPCRSAYGKEHYLKHRSRYIDQAAKLKRRVRRER